VAGAAEHPGRGFVSIAEQRGFVGVDVVDLLDRRCVGKVHDARFLTRVLNDVERAALATAPDPTATLWRLWTAKEATFKVVSKVRGAPPAFVHAAFRVDLPGPQVKSGIGNVEWEDISVFIHWHEMPGRIAALAWNGVAADGPPEWAWGTAADLDPEPTALMDELLEKLSERERLPVHSRNSALVRLAARAALARALGVDEARIEVVCGEGPKGRVPPEALIDGRSAPADVSLSHHGKWLAWAIRPTGPRPAQDAPER
jgi:phosphopantetheinyl transferase